MKAVISIMLVALFVIMTTGCDDQNKEDNNPIEYGG